MTTSGSVMSQDATPGEQDMSREFDSHSQVSTNEDSAVFGAPLEPSTISLSSGTIISDEDITACIRPLLFRMYIAAHILRLGTEARYSALVFLHRYARATSRTSNKGTLKRPSQWVAAACLFLASKSEDEPRRLRDMINMAQMVLNDDDNDNYNTIHNPSPITLQWQPTPPHLDEHYWDAKKKIIDTEQIVLRWLGFDVFVPHPHRAVALLLRHLPPHEQELIAPFASQRLNDGLFHASSLRHGVLELACAAMELAKQQLGRTNNLGMPQGWWHEYKISDASLHVAMTHLQESTDMLKNLWMRFPPG